MSQLTPEQRAKQAVADELGREFCTMIDGRIAIILRPRASEAETGELFQRIVRALEALVDN